MDLRTALPLSITALLAVSGYLATYFYNLKLAVRKDRLERINQQLREFYGPLFALTSAGRMAFTSFMDRYATKEGEPTPAEFEKFRAWMRDVFMPINTRMLDVITGHADLIEEDEMPQCLLDLCAHVEAYIPLVAQWERGDLSEMLSVIDFPRSIELYAAETYRALKAEQGRLLSRPSKGS
jgi:hypothetical protein